MQDVAQARGLSKLYYAACTASEDNSLEHALHNIPKHNFYCPLLHLMTIIAIVCRHWIRHWIRHCIRYS